MKKYSDHILTLLIAVFLWSFTITGLIAFLVSGMKFNRWITSLSALVLTLTSRHFSGKWFIYLGNINSFSWHLEVIFGLFSWIIAAAIVSAITHFIATKADKYRMNKSSRGQSQYIEAHPNETQ